MNAAETVSGTRNSPLLLREALRRARRQGRGLRQRVRNAPQTRAHRPPHRQTKLGSSVLSGRGAVPNSLRGPSSKANTKAANNNMDD